MRLTRFTDYTLRTLMYLARHPDSYITINEIARAYQISSNHLMKIAQHLAAEGDVVTMRGQHGGLRLARPAETIRLGQVVMNAEPDMELLPCEEAGAVAPIDAIGGLVQEARDAFFAALDRHTLADLIADRPAAESALRHPPETLTAATA